MRSSISCDGGADVDLARRDAERPHQRMRAVERVPAGGEAGQRVAEDVAARQAEPVEGAHRDQRRLRRVEPARDADHDLLEAGRGEALHQPLDLDVVDLGAALVAARGIGRHVGEALDATAAAARGPPARRRRTRCDGIRAAARACACALSPKLVRRTRSWRRWSRSRSAVTRPGFEPESASDSASRSPFS